MASTADVVKSPSTAGAPKLRRRAAEALKKVESEDEGTNIKGGNGSSSSTMMKLYTSDSGDVGLKVDPVIVLALAVVFVLSVVTLHLFTKVVRSFTK